MGLGGVAVRLGFGGVEGGMGFGGVEGGMGFGGVVGRSGVGGGVESEVGGGVVEITGFAVSYRRPPSTADRVLESQAGPYTGDLSSPPSVLPNTSTPDSSW